MSVVWKFENKYKANAENAYEEITSLESITPQSVVDLARCEDSVIHNDFEWDDEIAGEKYRICQARDMLRSFVLVSDAETDNHRDTAYELNEKDDRGCDDDYPSSPRLRALYNTSGKNEYAPAEYFIQNDDEYQILLVKAKKELESFKRKYAVLSELEEVFIAINNL